MTCRTLFRFRRDKIDRPYFQSGTKIAKRFNPATKKKKKEEKRRKKKRRKKKKIYIYNCLVAEAYALDDAETNATVPGR